MVPMLRMLLCLGLSLGPKTEVLAGTLTKPKIWAEPHSVIAIYAPVTIWCQGSWEAKEYFLLKEESTCPWDQQSPLEHSDKVEFYIQHMTEDFAGMYKCYYKSPAGSSEHSDILELVITGAYDKPSLSVWPSPAVTSGETTTMQCSSSLEFDTFTLIQEGEHHLQWILDSQQSANREFQAHFVLDPVTTIHNGTFRCYGYFRGEPQVWSKSNDSLHLLVSDSKDQSLIHTEYEPTASQHKSHTVEKSHPNDHGCLGSSDSSDSAVSSLAQEENGTRYNQKINKKKCTRFHT